MGIAGGGDVHLRVLLRLPRRARFWLWFHGLRTIFWIAMLPVSFATGWSNMIPYVTALSIWALVETAAGNWQAARAEVQAEIAAAVTPAR
jgi:hypothetical protein